HEDDDAAGVHRDPRAELDVEHAGDRARPAVLALAGPGMDPESHHAAQDREGRAGHRHDPAARGAVRAREQLHLSRRPPVPPPQGRLSQALRAELEAPDSTGVIAAALVAGVAVLYLATYASIPTADGYFYVEH